MSKRRQRRGESVARWQRRYRRKGMGIMKPVKQKEGRK